MIFSVRKLRFRNFLHLAKMYHTVTDQLISPCIYISPCIGLLATSLWARSCKFTHQGRVSKGTVLGGINGCSGHHMPGQCYLYKKEEKKERRKKMLLMLCERVSWSQEQIVQLKMHNVMTSLKLKYKFKKNSFQTIL